jgi:hypothetical protein
MRMKALIILVCVATCVMSCRKNGFITSPDARVSVSSDTLQFDTVFTTTGSATRFFRIYNDNEEKLRLTSVLLGGGQSSYFKINVDGSPGVTVSDIEIEPNDSIYVFVTVKIDPSAANLPFIVRDSIGIAFNGVQRWVQLEAWGQNANFFRSVALQGTHTWNNTKPYVILGGLQVDTNATLIIQEGTKVFVHADAPIVVDGTLIVNGDKYDSTRVSFTGDRLDDPYNSFPASWPGIFFRTVSRNNIIRFAKIRNAYQGIVAENPSTNANPKVRIENSHIDNCYDAGIGAVRSDVTVTNTVISNCGKNVVLIYGGNYSFTHCTVAAYSTSFLSHTEPVLVVTDFLKQENTTLTGPLNASFVNSIFWGDNSIVEDEVVTGKQGGGPFNVSFENCLWKVKTDPPGVTASEMINNQDPLFENIDFQKRIFNFRLSESSPAVDKGRSTTVITDFDNAPRSGIPDIGAFER